MLIFNLTIHVVIQPLKTTYFKKIFILYILGMLLLTNTININVKLIH